MICQDKSNSIQFKKEPKYNYSVKIKVKFQVAKKQPG